MRSRATYNVQWKKVEVHPVYRKLSFRINILDLDM